MTELSVIVPFYNEEANVRWVLEEIRNVLPHAEIIAVDDGSTDRTWAVISGLSDITGLRLKENRGQSAAMFLGMSRASGAAIALMDGDGQNDPADIPRLLEIFHQPEVDIVCGWRERRQDRWSRKVTSRWANRIRRALLDDGVRDTGCSLKVFSREAFSCLVPFNGLHRYLPALFKQAGLRIEEVPVNHRPRREGVSKYTNWDRAWRGVYDLVGVRWLLKRKINFPKIERS